jgi:hypothetical protein
MKSWRKASGFNWFQFYSLVFMSLGMPTSAVGRKGGTSHLHFALEFKPGPLKGMPL